MGLYIIVAGLLVLLNSERVNGFFCTFETDTCGFVQSENDEFDWVRISRRFSLLPVSPRAYMYARRGLRSSPGDVARMATPAITPTSLSSCLSFSYQMQNRMSGQLIVLIKVGLNPPEIAWSLTGYQDRRWRRATVPINITTNATVKVSQLMACFLWGGGGVGSLPIIITSEAKVKVSHVMVDGTN
ncbi:predicted protein [Nematostella vectensis]|uniref:MAM domain-containing protein n=1 Tax=Nematostella vectensis TaxID=45351 RepID=A7TAQ6_NEMVE|nr:predicted protein [Nematostella vectensis]|eukprot:XP_001619014.1 hypothetical protein NEMVEDRAFT_v1g224599 [Nematostella vectensis]